MIILAIMLCCVLHQLVPKFKRDYYHTHVPLHLQNPLTVMYSFRFCVYSGTNEIQRGFPPLLSTLVLNAKGDIGALALEVIENFRQLFLFKLISINNVYCKT